MTGGAWEPADVRFDHREWRRFEAEVLATMREAFVEMGYDEERWPGARDMVRRKLLEVRLLKEPRLSDRTAH